MPIFVLFQRIYGNNVAVVAAFLAAMSPFLARYSAHVRTEIPYLFLSTCALQLFHSGIKHRLWSRFFYGGLLAGLAYLTRPRGVGFLMVIPLALAIECWVRRDRQRARCVSAARSRCSDSWYSRLPTPST